MSSGDVVIIGGGIVGSCTALFLARAGIGDVLVVEKDLSYDNASTSRSASAIRQQFHLGVNVAMSHFGYTFFSRLGEFVPDTANGDVAFVERGYLVLATEEARERLQLAHDRQIAVGAQVDLVEGEELRARFPWLKTDDLGAATFGTAGEGWFDPIKALRTVRAGAEGMGVRYIEDEVVGLEVSGGSVTSVATSSGTTIPCGAVVDAAGADAGAVARMAGIHVTIEGRRRTVFVFRPVAAFHHDLPNLVDPTVAGRGMYVRPYGDDFLAVTAPPPERDPDTRSLEPDLYLFDDVLREALARRVTGFEDLELVRAWAGLYEMNTFDQNAVIGEHPDLSGFFLACGFSGHGVMHAPAAGRGIAELIAAGRFETLDLSPFRVERIAAGKTLDDIQPSEKRDHAAGI